MRSKAFGRQVLVLSWLLFLLLLSLGGTGRGQDDTTFLLLNQDDHVNITNPLALNHKNKGRLVTAAGVDVFVIEDGSQDDEPVLCLHGVPASSFVFRKVLPELAKRGYRAIAIDFPGLGFSSRPDPKLFDYSWTGMGEWLSAAIGEESLVAGMDKFHLVVHDFGAPWGITMVAAHPERILSLTILNSPLVNLGSWVIPLPMAPLTKPVPIIDSVYLATWQPPLFLLVQYIWGVLLDPTEFGLKESEAYLQQLRYSDYHARAFLAIMKGIEQTSDNEDLYINAINDLNVPKQIIWPNGDPGFPVKDYAIPLQKKTGIDRLFIVKGKHFVQENQYVAIAEYIDEMLRLQS